MLKILLKAKEKNENQENILNRKMKIVEQNNIYRQK